MRQINILDLDFGAECKESKQLVEEAVKIIKEKSACKKWRNVTGSSKKQGSI